MAENLYCKDHKAGNETYRREFDRIFRKGTPYADSETRTRLPDDRGTAGDRVPESAS